MKASARLPSTALALCVLLAALVNVASADNRSFVYADGIKFKVDGKDFYFAGTSWWDAATAKYSSSDVATALATHASKGMNVIRVFTYSNGVVGSGAGYRDTDPIQPTPGVFSESALRRLDFLVAECAKHNLRLIFVFGNFEPELGGWQWWVDQMLGYNKDKELFLTDSRIKQAFKNWISKIITRTNTFTGVQYKDDPTIFAWECTNEPHTSNEYERNRSWTPGKLVNNWLAEMSSYIKELDCNHMVSTGEEGYRADGDPSPPHNNWLNGGYKGVDFVANTQLPDTDFATVHVYPDNWQVAGNEYQWVGPNYIADRAQIAHAAGKPIIMEEYGMMENPSYLPSRNILLNYLQDQANSNQYAGTLVWQALPANLCFWQPKSYVFCYGGDGSDALLKEYSYMKSKSG